MCSNTTRKKSGARKIRVILTYRAAPHRQKVHKKYRTFASMRANADGTLLVCNLHSLARDGLADRMFEDVRRVRQIRDGLFAWHPDILCATGSIAQIVCCLR